MKGINEKENAFVNLWFARAHLGEMSDNNWKNEQKFNVVKQVNSFAFNAVHVFLSFIPAQTHPYKADSIYPFSQ